MRLERGARQAKAKCVFKKGARQAEAKCDFEMVLAMKRVLGQQPTHKSRVLAKTGGKYLTTHILI